MTTTKTTTASHVAGALPGRQPAVDSNPAAPSAHGLRHFLRHLVEMVLAMFAGMLLLDLLWEAVFTALGAAAVLAQPEVSAAVMATDMTLGMSAWMVHRRHSPAAIAEMGAAMYLSFLLAILAYWLGPLAADTALMIGHVLMVPAMVAAMLLRRDEYVHGDRPAARAQKDTTEGED